MPPGLTGTVLLAQGFVLDGSAPNGLFVTTDAHLIEFVQALP